VPGEVLAGNATAGPPKSNDIKVEEVLAHCIRPWAKPTEVMLIIAANVRSFFI